MHMNISQKQSYARIYSKNNISQAAFYARIYAKKMPQNLAVHTLCEAAIEMHMDISQVLFYARIVKKNAGAWDCDNPSTRILCKPAGSTWTWTSHWQEQLYARDFVWACATEMHINISQEQLYARIGRKSPDGAPWSNPGL